jgi:hypothetical protein
MHKKMLINIMLVASMLMSSVVMAKRAGQAVTVVMKDGTTVDGDMLGMDSDSITLRTEGGKSRDIPLAKVKKVFGEDGKAISLTSGSSEAAQEEAPVASESSQDEEQPVSRRSDRRSSRRESSRASARSHAGTGMRVAGAVLGGVGLAGALIGLVVWEVGQSEMTSATSYYYTAPYSTYYYTIPETGSGKYYDYTQYYDYYEGQGYATTGAWVAVVGGVIGVTGIILLAAAPRDRNVGLINLEDKQLAWDLPAMTYDPRLKKTELTLLNAKF